MGDVFLANSVTFCLLKSNRFTTSSQACGDGVGQGICFTAMTKANVLLYGLTLRSYILTLTITVMIAGAILMRKGSRNIIEWKSGWKK